MHLQRTGHDLHEILSSSWVPTMKRCPMCPRTYATDADWAALVAEPTTGSCSDDACPWGGDRCWNAGACGVPAEAVLPQVSAATALRGRQPWAAVAHSRA